MDIKVGDIIRANGHKFVVTGEPYIPSDLDEDSAVDKEYCKDEYIIPVDNGGAVYESEVMEISPSSGEF